MYTQWSLPKLGESSRPSRPPSPLVPETPGILPSVVRTPLGDSSITVCASRSVKMPSPLGRNARPHGTSLSVAIVVTAPTPPPPPALVLAVAVLLGLETLPARARARTSDGYVVFALRFPTLAVRGLASVGAT